MKWRNDLIVKKSSHIKLLQIVLDESGYSAMLKNKKDLDNENRLENIKELLSAMKEFDNLESFLEHVALATSIDQNWDGEKINMMTMHAAKGLEFDVVFLPGYWESWYMSSGRVFAGFIMAQIIGIPFGLALAVNRYFKDIFFPPFEILRPIPPLAWVPASIVFWPTTEMSIAFVTFLGAFFTIVINVLGGAKSIDIRYLRAAQSMGASQWHLFTKIILPGTLPSIFTGAAVGMGITWEVVLAGEMISGGGGQQASGGLGFFIWSSYMGGTVASVIVGMISIGIAGYLSSSLIRFIGSRSMPWRNLF